MAPARPPLPCPPAVRNRPIAFYAAGILGLLCLAVVAIAQQPSAIDGPAKLLPPTAENNNAAALQELAVHQGKVADKYANLEQLLIRMAEIEATSNPQRAALLKRAAQQSTDRLTRQQLNALVRLLTPPSQLQRAIDEQQQVVTDLKALLDLLQSEDRAGRIKSERERIREYIQELDRVLRMQKSVQGRTEGGDDAAKLAKDQADVADRTGKLDRRIQENEEGGASSDATADEKRKSAEGGNTKRGASDGKKADGSKSDGSKSDGSKSDGSKSDGSKSDGSKSDGSKSDGSKSDGSKSDGSKSDGSKSDGSKSDGSKSDGSKSDGSKSNGNKSDGSKSDGSKSNGNKSDGSKSDGSKSDGNKSDGNKSDGNKSDGNKSDGSKAGGKNAKAPGQKPGGSSKPGTSKSPKPGGKSKGQPNGEPNDADGPDPDDAPDKQDQEEQQNPVRKRLQAAEDRMREAQQKLAKAKQREAVEDQQVARDELERARAELERILRQLREEEIERTLALLEGRIRRLLETQIRIYESTMRLDKIPTDQRTRDVDILASKLGFDESKLAVDAEKALLVLREEGSSVAFPETLELVRDDMQQVATRLSQSRVDRITQGIEEDIVQALTEMEDSLKRARQELQEKRKPMPPPPGGKKKQQQPGDRPLVDQIAELKLIRSLQVRVNSRTQRFSRLLDDADDPVGRANDAELRKLIEKLAEMEQRIFGITRNIVLGKNE